MRISFIPGALDTLSGEHFPHLIHMQENIRALRKKAEVNILTADKANAEYMRFRRTRLHKIVNDRSLHIIRKFLNLMFFFAVYAELKKKIDHQQNDLFLIRFSFSNYLISRYLYSRGYKILLEVHALAHVEEKEYGQSYAPPFYFALIAYLEKRILGWADQIYTVSESLKNFLVALGIDKQTIHAIDNGVNPDTFDHTIDPQSIINEYELENKIVIGFVGSFAKYHGVEMLLDIAEKLQNKYENINMLIVGKNVHGSDNVMKTVLARGLCHIFTFTGEVPHSRIPSYIAAMDIAVIPDFNTYGSPMKLFEYMVMRKPVVAPEVPAIGKVVKDGDTGILFERGNIAQATKGIENLIENEDLRNELGARAHRKVIISHTWDQNAERIVNIAERMIE